MSKKSKIWLITATFLVLTGLIIFAGTMTSLGWDFKKLSTEKYLTSSYEISEEYSGISIVTDTADIEFIPSDKTTVICYEDDNSKHKVSVKEGILTIAQDNSKKWYENIGIGFETSKITLYIPHGEYGKLSIKTGTGDIGIPKNYKFESIDISASTGNTKCHSSSFGSTKIKASTGDILIKETFASSLDLSVSTGKITVTDSSIEKDVKVKVSTGKAVLDNLGCKSLISSGNTGDIHLKEVMVSDKLSIERSTGDIDFNSCDAKEIHIKTDTGDVKGTLLSEKVFITQSDTGYINVPQSAKGGKCEIITDTGDIEISIIS